MDASEQGRKGQMDDRGGLVGVEKKRVKEWIKEHEGVCFDGEYRGKSSLLRSTTECTVRSSAVQKNVG